ncbi:hypothetical protein HDK77DRAFT_4724 [Phyllosticta capitalensis]
MSASSLRLFANEFPVLINTLFGSHKQHYRIERFFANILLCNITFLYLLFNRIFWLNSDRDKVYIAYLPNLIFGLSAGLSYIRYPALRCGEVSVIKRGDHWHHRPGACGVHSAHWLPFPKNLVQNAFKKPDAVQLFYRSPARAWTRVAHINDWQSPELHHIHALLLFNVYCF